MDPNANIQEIKRILADPNPDRCRLALLLESLAGWIDKGGFLPTWPA